MRISSGVMIVWAGNTIGRITPSARRWCREYLGVSARRGSDVPRVLREWLSRGLGERNQQGRRPFVAEREGRRLLVHCLPSLNQSVLLFEERMRAQHTFWDMGLTPREAEVLRWLAAGKTNPEIGRILSISARTAQIHLNHIYRKLGVENRTAAVAVAFEMSEPRGDAGRALGAGAERAAGPGAVDRRALLRARPGLARVGRPRASDQAAGRRGA